MNRRVFSAALAVLLLPTAAAAQLMNLQDDPEWGPRFRITPFIGYLTSIERDEQWSYRLDGTTGFESPTLEIAGGPAVGLNIELPLRGRLGITAAGLFGSRGETTFVVPGTGEEFQIDGNRVFMGRLGVSLQLRESVSELTLRRLGASVFAGGTVLHERPRNEFSTADYVGNGTHFGIHGGVNAELPFATDRLALQVGIEDHVIWWRDGFIDDLAGEYFRQRTGSTSVETRASADVSHNWLLRAGISFRFR